ncbi:MAG TPA: hypothetical protein VK581_07140 [Chthoniobacterales bacterium]|nr:hypothetical protein [Chthoniobacterales bacterium]
MFDSFLVYAGFAIIAAGSVSLVWPLRFLGIRTRLVATMIVAVGAALEFIAGEMIDSYLVYLGLILFLVGLFSLILPIRFLAIRTRPVGAVVAAGGLLLAVIVLVLPVSGKEVTVPATRLDDWMPRWQVGEQHTIYVTASPEKVFEAIHAVRANEIFLFRTLTAIRRCGQKGPESILDAPEEKSILDVATQTSFVLLGEEAPHELVIGTVVSAPATVWASGRRLTPEVFHETLPPGFALATMNFLARPDNHGGSTISTETRIYANTPAALRQFVVYWRIIHPGSDVIRRMWLRAIKQRAEG